MLMIVIFPVMDLNPSNWMFVSVRKLLVHI